MRYRRLSPNGDYTFGGGSNDMLRDREACAQAIRTRLLLLFGEWWENLQEGLPLFQGILGQRAIKSAEKLIHDRINSTQHVNQITFYQSYFNPDTREFTFYATVDTDYGVITLEEVTL